MSTHVTNSTTLTTLSSAKPHFEGDRASLFWHTLDELRDVGEVWSNSDAVKLALVTWDCASKIDPVVQRYLSEEQADRILAEVTLRKRDRSVGGGFFFGPPRVALLPKDIEQEIGGMLTYESRTERLLMFHRAQEGHFTNERVWRLSIVSGIYAHVRG